MITLEFKKQTSRFTPSLKFTFAATNDKATIAAILGEATTYRKTLELISHEHENTSDQFISSLTFGISVDSKVEAVAANTFNSAFFAADNTFIGLWIRNNTAAACQLSGGTTAGGFDLFTSEPLAGGETRFIPFSLATGTTPMDFYIHTGGTDDTWNGTNVDFKTISI